VSVSVGIVKSDGAVAVSQGSDNRNPGDTARRRPNDRDIALTRGAFLPE
jgi:hypothetical protein